jgi:hypothetical protein
VEDSDLPTKDDLSFKNFDTTVEQDQDKEIAEIKDQLLHDKENKNVQNKFILLYYNRILQYLVTKVESFYFALAILKYS